MCSSDLIVGVPGRDVVIANEAFIGVRVRMKELAGAEGSITALLKVFRDRRDALESINRAPVRRFALDARRRGC